MKPQRPLPPEAQKLVFEVTKQLITLSVVGLGFVTSMLFTTFKGTPFVISALCALFGFLVSAASGVLTQLAVVAESLDENQWGRFSYPRLLLHCTWIAFIGALIAFIVFTSASIKAAA